MRLNKFYIILILVSAGFHLNSVNLNAQNVANMAVESAVYLNSEEKEMLNEINLVRTNPRNYVVHIKELLERTVQDSARLSLMTSESIKTRVVYEDYGEVITVDTIVNNYYKSRVVAIRELIDELNNAEPVKSLMPIEGLYIAAKKHGDSQVKNSHINHFGLDGTWPLDRIRHELPWTSDGNENISSGKGSPREMVIQLLVDSGVSKRGHRRNILNPQWTHFSCYNVRALNQEDYKWWIQEFAY